MSENTIIPAKQLRSQQTQDNLLHALNELLKEHFFEHISIAQLADAAGVSVGTYYRRFKNKESLLPLLYQNFGLGLQQWVSQLEQQSYPNLKSLIPALVEETIIFLEQNSGVMRTLHLNSRLYPEILPSSQLSERSSEYQRMALLLHKHEKEITHPNKEEGCNMAIFILVSSLIEKTLYNELTPSIAAPMDKAKLIPELTRLLFSYLTAK